MQFQCKFYFWCKMFFPTKIIDFYSVLLVQNALYWNAVLVEWSQSIYMVQYSIIQHFYQKSGKSWNFHLPVIFKVMHVMSSYVSQNVHMTMKVLASISLALRTFSMGMYQTPKIGCFCYFPKYCILVAVISQLVKKLQ